MNKSVLMSIQPYYMFLIIARSMGWNISQEKTVEVRKRYPEDSAWNKRVNIYCSKNKKSFYQIPVQYQPFMKKLLGKVIGEFVCDRIEVFTAGSLRCDDIEKLACLSHKEMIDYFYKPEELDGKTAKFGYALHITDLKIYDTPKELGEFIASTPKSKFKAHGDNLNRPPMSWCYVEEI